MARDIKVTLAGDSGVGKSSLVTALVKDAWAERVQKVVPEILLPLDVTEAGVTTRIVDTAVVPERRNHLESSLRSSHVIILVYSISSPTSFDRIPTYWLPYIRSLGINVPVILVGNKIDLRTEGILTNEALEDELAPVMQEFKEVESCIETSVKEGINISEVFYFAQKAVLYPTAPLYDSKLHTLKEPCVAALQRIFKLCDSDKDHLLSDDELNDFQRRCFGAPLQQQELEGIKDLVLSTPVPGLRSSSYMDLRAERDRDRDRLRDHDGRLSTGGARSVSSSGSNGDGSTSTYGRAGSSSAAYHPHLRDGKLTMLGWLHLHTLFIQRGRLETTWAVLSSYGYGHDLALAPEYLNPPSFAVPSDCAVELSPYGYAFLTDIFEAHDKDRDGALCAEEMEELFSTAPGGRHPWEDTDFPNTTVTDENGAVTLQGWLAQWSMTTLLDYKVTLANLAYLGYPSFVLGGGNAGGSGSGGGSGSKGRHPDMDPPPSSSGSVTPPWAGGGGAASAARGPGSPPPTTTTALKLTRRNTRRLFSSSSFGSSSSPPHASGSASAKKKKKKGDPAERSVFLAYVVGAAGSGKSSLLRAMVGKRFEPTYTPTAGGRVRSVVSAVEQGGMERYLVLQEFGAAYEADALRSSARLAAADVVLFVWDSSDTNSFSYVSNLRGQYPALAYVPSLFVATKADLDLAQQRHEVQPDVYCRKLGLNPHVSPLHVSALEGRMSDLYGVTCTIAQDPRGTGAIPGGERGMSVWWWWWPFGGAGGNAGGNAAGAADGTGATDGKRTKGTGAGSLVLYVGVASLIGGGAVYLAYRWRGASGASPASPASFFGGGGGGGSVSKSIGPGAASGASAGAGSGTGSVSAWVYALWRGVGGS